MSGWFTRVVFVLGTAILLQSGSPFGPALVASVASAQPGLQSAVETELDRTDELLERAAEIVREALGPRPAGLLEEARKVQERARHEGPVRARLLTQQARKMALRAIELAKAQIRLLERVRQLLAENRELVRHAREIVESSGDPVALRLLESGVEQLSRGQRAFTASEFRLAVRLSLFGRDLLLRAIRTADGENALTRESVGEEIRRTDEFLREARAAVEDDGAVRRRYEEAERLQKEARLLADRGQLDRAGRLTLRARESALDILRRETADPEPAEVEALIQRVSERFEELNAETGDADDAPVKLLMEQAQAHLREARRAMADGDVRRALAEAQLAASILGQAADLSR